MQAGESVVGTAEIQARSRRFASLRAAQRAIGDALHPQELQRSVEQGRDVLGRLQELSQRARAFDGAGEVSPEERRAAANELARVDALLSEISQRTREIVGRIAISELRAALPALASQQADTVKGLIEVLLEGDLEAGKTMRLLEYLVTLLSVEERDLRRTVRCDPGEVVPSLRRVAEERFGAADPQCIAAERVFERAAAEIQEQQEVGQVRDRIRRFKDELGSRILHPRVLVAAVAYNTAMWNRLADLIEGGRTLDRLAEELIAGDAARATGVPSLFDSHAFANLVRALRARICGEEPEDAACGRIVEAFDLGSLAPDELEAFEVSETIHHSGLVCSAVTLGLAVRHRGQVAGELAEIGLDPELLAPHWPRELAREMMASASKLVASGRYVDASRLLELKTRNLGMAVQADTTSGATGASVRAAAPRTREDEAPEVHLSLPLIRQTLVTLGLALALVLSAVLLWPREPAMRIYSSSQVAELSAYLRNGHRSLEDGTSRFVGTLNARWDGIDLATRRRVAGEIAERLAADGVETVLLVDGYRRIQARADHGVLVEVAAPPGAGDAAGDGPDWEDADL